MDRIDLWVFVQNISYDELSKKSNEEKLSDNMRAQIITARNMSKKRFQVKNIESKLEKSEDNKLDSKKIKYKLNKSLSGKELSIMSPLGEKETEILNNLASKLSISPRAYHRMIRVARTIADLDNSEHIKDVHIIEAFQYRPKLN